MGNKVILRVAKIKNFGQLKGYQQHVNREQETLNSDTSKEHLNFVTKGNSNVIQVVDEFIKSRGIKITQGKKNQSVLCTEMLLTASPDFFKKSDGTLDEEKTERWIFENHKWLQDKYGDNYLFGKCHLDETSPHLSAIVCATKYHKAYKREVLAHKAYFGKSNKKNCLEELQTEYAKAMQECGFELERGKSKSIAKHKDIKDFYADLNNTKEKVNTALQEKDLLIKEISKELEETKKETAKEINIRTNIIKKLADEFNIEKEVQEAYKQAKELNKESQEVEL